MSSIQSQIIFLSFLAFFYRVIWNYLPEAIAAALDGEISWSELRSFWAYLIRADLLTVDYFAVDERPCGLMVTDDLYVGERDS